MNYLKIKTTLKEIWSDTANWNFVAQDRDKRRAVFKKIKGITKL
jgi:hypothetical protein